MTLPEPVVRGAVGDSDLRVMTAELVAFGACAMITGHFQGLRSSQNPDVVSGVLWLRNCRIRSSGTRVTFELTGSGWQWVEESKHEAGGTFTVKQYVGFEMLASVSGEIDIGYDPSSHVASVWFSPDALPAVTFKPVGGIEVDAEDAWSSVLGALSSIVSSSPEETAEQQAKSRGAGDMKREFSRGISATIDLCTGLTRSGLGRGQRGAMRPASVGESREIWAELEPGGLMLIGPLDVPDALTVDVVVSGEAAVDVSLVCNKAAETIARAYTKGAALPAVPVLTSNRLGGGRAVVQVTSPGCPVTLVARPAQDAAVRFAWRRRVKESARSSGGPVIDCDTRPPPPEAPRRH